MTKMTEGFRLSPQQKRLWQLRQTGPAAPYQVQAAVSLEGTLDREALQAALTQVAQQYEILRTLFHHPSGLAEPVQVIAGQGQIVFKYYDLTGVDADAQCACVDDRAEMMRCALVDLDQGPLLQAALLKLAAAGHLLLLTLPALAGDAATLDNLVRPLSRAYAAQAAARGPVEEEDDDEAVMQYADLAEWYSQLLESEDAEAAAVYWRSLDVPSFLAGQMPLQKPAPPDAFNPQAVSLTLAPEIVVGVQRLVSRSQTSPAALLATCWQVFLWRLGGQSPPVTGVASDGRAYEELAGAVGPLTRYLPLVTHLEEERRFDRLLTQVHEALAAVSDLQEYFAWDRLGPTPVPFFPYLFEFEERPAPQTAAGVSFTVDSLYSCLDRFELRLAARRQEAALTLAFYYDAARFEGAEAQRLAGQFRRLLQSAVENPAAQIGALDLLPAEQREQILVAFNDAPRVSPPAQDIPALIEAQAGRVPDRTAVVCEDRSLTYAALNGRANKLAHYLRRAGVRPDTPVGLYMKRSVEMVVGILGVLKAGGAYVPLDPAYPPDRLAFILEDTQAPVLVTQARLREALAGQTAQVLCLETDWPAIDRRPEANPDRLTGPDNLAYIIYTSGSTGVPKGVPISRRNLIHSTAARLAYYENPVDRFLLLPSFSFDSSVAGLFWTLGQGGTLVIPPEETAGDPRGLAQLIARQRITHMLCLPSLYGFILAEAAPVDLASSTPPNRSKPSNSAAPSAPGAPAEKLKSLETVIVAGEACPAALVERHTAVLPGTALFNEYGPTEGTVWSTVYDCLRPWSGSRPPIGRPIANTQVYILDSRLRPVPIGVAGELHIGGGGLARGYLNRPALTAEKFIPNPFAPDQAGARRGDAALSGEQAQADRLYKTGDLARYLPDGAIEFLGRVDHQVKIRGYRVELGEIEAALEQHPLVQEAVVVATARSQPALETDPAALTAALTGLDEDAAEQLLAEVEQMGGAAVEAALKL